MKYRTFHFFLFLVLSLFGHSQEGNVLIGKVIDSATKEPLSFSTISIKGQDVGVVSNFLGEFEFRFSSEYTNDSLHISMLGYLPQVNLISDIDLGQPLIITLSENIIELQEIKITAEKLNAKEIIEKVLENIPINYPTSPYLQKGFTRSHKRECGKYVTLYEAAFDLYGIGYHKKSPERVYINESRQSKPVDYYHSRVLRNNRNLFIANGHLNDLLYRSGSLQTARHNYEIKSFTEVDGRLVYVVETSPSKFVSHRLFVDAENFALLKLEMKMSTPDDEVRNPHLNQGPSSDSLQFQVTTLSKTLQFEKVDTKYFLKYSDWLVEGILIHNKTNELFCDWGFRFEMMFDEFITENIEKPSNQHLMRPRAGRDPKSTSINTSFWNDYQLLDQFPITPQIIEDLKSAHLLGSELVQYANDEK